MRLYTIQSLEVLEILTSYSIYFPSFEHCGMLQGDNSFERPYKWLMEQYNILKKNEFSSAAVWWQTDIKEVLKCFKRQQKQGTNQILLMANVDNKDILLLDDELWCIGPFMNCSLGFRGSHLSMSDDWTSKDEELFDKIHNVYDTNEKAKEETWKQIFKVNKHTEMIHAITPFIMASWIKPNTGLETTYEM
jgi:hypothetical protein